MSTKELKNKKRTKLVWYDNTIDWEKLPLVILAKALEKQDWFRGKTALRIAREDFERGGHRPEFLSIEQQHKTIYIVVHVEWIFSNWSHCVIKLCTPYPDEDYKTTRSRYIEGALERIKKAFEDAIPIVDRLITKEEEAERKKVEAKEHHSKLCKELGIEVESKYQYEYTYRQGKGFGMAFSVNPKQTDLFNIHDVWGKFGTKELKQFIKIIGGNPRAVASRLTGKKR